LLEAWRTVLTFSPFPFLTGEAIKEADPIYFNAFA